MIHRYNPRVKGFCIYSTQNKSDSLFWWWIDLRFKVQQILDFNAIHYVSYQGLGAVYVMPVRFVDSKFVKG